MGARMHSKRLDEGGNAESECSLFVKLESVST